MSLTVRLLRSLWAFGLILADYLIQIGLRRLFMRTAPDPDKPGRTKRYRPDWLKARRKRVDARNADRALAAMLRLRGVYIKLGQVLSIMGGFLPRVYTKKLQVLQDQVPPHGFHEVEKVFKESFGKLPSECFRDIEREPIAAASLGQVHSAHLHDGTRVAVKILYPGIRDVIRVDMRVVRLALRVYKWFVPVQGLENAYNSLVDLLKRETDYRHEAACMERFSKNFESDADILAPSVVHEFTSADILTMTFMEGVKITDFDKLEQMGVDRKAVAKRMVQSFYKQLFVDRFFHADPHPGNFLVQKGEGDKPVIVVLDYGAISEATDDIIEGLMDTLQGGFTGDVEQLLAGFERMGFVAENADTDQLEKIVRTYFSKLMKFRDKNADMSPGAMMSADRSQLEELADPEMDIDELRDLMKSVQYPDTWFYVERASVVMFWLCATIDPSVDTVQVGLPYVMPLMMERNKRAAEERARAKAKAKSGEADSAA